MAERTEYDTRQQVGPDVSVREWYPFRGPLSMVAAAVLLGVLARSVESALEAISDEPENTRGSSVLELTPEEIRELQTSTQTPTETPTPTATEPPEVITNPVWDSTYKPGLSREVDPEILDGYAQESPQIIFKLEANPELFDVQTDVEDLKIYYPIYRAAQDKFKVPWYLLWIMHQAESTVSKDPNAFVVGSYGQYGAMQRVTRFHFKEDVDFASRGLEFLADFNQRHPDDWQEISWAAMKISQDRQSTGSILGALKRYSAAGSAEERYQRFLTLEAVFGGNP